MLVVLVGTLDTKGNELAYVRDLLAEQGLETLVIDAGSMGAPHFVPDVDRAEVFRHAGSTVEAVSRRGDRGDAVRDVQQRLSAVGVRATVDGVYGEETADAVREFQRRRGLRVDGICGPDTWGALIESGA